MRDLPKGRAAYNRQERAFSDALASVRYFYDEMDSGAEWIHTLIDDFVVLMDKCRLFPPTDEPKHLTIPEPANEVPS